MCAPGGRDSGGLASQGSGLLHAQSSTIMLPTGHEGSDAEDMYDAEEEGDAVSFFSAQSHLGGGGGGSLPRFSDLPASAQTSTLDLLLITGRHAPAEGATGRSGTVGDAPAETPECGSQAAAVGFTTSTQAAARMQLQHSSVLCSDLLVRLHTEGWGVAAACLKQYAAAAATPVSAGEGAGGRGDEEPLRQPPRDAAGPTRRIDCSSWLIEVVATGGTGATTLPQAGRPLPPRTHPVRILLCRKSTACLPDSPDQVAHDMSFRTAEMCRGADAGSSTEVPSVSLEGAAWARLQGRRLLQAHLPSLLLRCSLVDPDYDIGVKATARQLGALLGVADVALTMPGALPLRPAQMRECRHTYAHCRRTARVTARFHSRLRKPGCHDVATAMLMGMHPTRHSHRQAKFRWGGADELLQLPLTLTIERISVWAHATRIFVAAAFVGAVQTALAPPATRTLPSESPPPAQEQEQLHLPAPPLNSASARKTPPQRSQTLRPTIASKVLCQASKKQPFRAV